MAKKKSLAQDTHREDWQVAHVGQTQSVSRMGKDARDEAGNPFEHKTSTKSNTAVSTARDVGLHTREKWESEYWIVSTGAEYKDDKTGIKEYHPVQMYICHPMFLKAEFDNIFAPLVVRQKIVEHIKELTKNDTILQTYHEETAKLFKRGQTLNDPKLHIAPFVQFGWKIDHINSKTAKEQVSEYVLQFPLDTKPKTKSSLQLFFEFN